METSKKETLAILSNIAEELATAKDAQSISDALFKVVDDFIDVPYSSIFLWDFKLNKLRLYANKGFTERTKNTAKIQPWKGTRDGFLKIDSLYMSVIWIHSPCLIT